MRALSILASLSLVGSAACVHAQQPPQPAPAPQPSRPRVAQPGEACTTDESGRIECRRTIERGGFARLDSAMMKRAVLGLSLSATGTARDTLGVFVSSVTPKGPAENAGIIEGDRIVAINGVDLRVSRADLEDSYASGLAAHRLQREVAKLTPGSRVNLRVYSGGRVRDVQVTAGRASDLMRTRTFIGIGQGPGTFIYGDGMTMPPMPSMAPMPPMENMRIMEMMPQLERLRAEMPEWRRFELRGPLLRMNQELRMLPRWDRVSPSRVYRLRRPSAAVKVSPQRAKVQAERKAKAKADSLKKNP